MGFERRGSRTILTERRFRLPLQALEPMELEPDDGATLMLLNPTGGILAGDRLETSITLGPGAQVCLTTAAATRVYRSLGPTAVQRFSARVGDGAVLEYLPDHLIPSPGARLHQAAEVALGVGATAILLDAWAVGRIARGEAWRFAELDSEIRVSDAGGPLLKERCRLSGIRGWDGLGAAEGFAYVAALAGLNPARASWENVASELAACFDAEAVGARLGASMLGRGGVLVRFLCPTAPVLQAAVQALWAVLRRRLLGREPPFLRKL